MAADIECNVNENCIDEITRVRDNSEVESKDKGKMFDINSSQEGVLGSRKEKAIKQDRNKNNKGIRVCGWNIAGSHKLETATKFLENYDMVILQETWAEEKNKKQWKKLLNSKFEWFILEATRNKSKGRAKGGQFIGIKKELKYKNSFVRWEGGVIIEGLKIESSTQIIKKYNIVTIYNNVGLDKIIDRFKLIINQLEEKNEGIIVYGDWNVRIGESQGYMKEGVLERKSEDKTINTQGNKFLEMCEDLNLTIINGRCNGDREGHITHIGRADEENSVLDYVLTNESMTGFIERLEIRHRTESDHLPVVFTINTSVGRKDLGKTYEAGERLDRESKREVMIWEDKAEELYKRNFQEGWQKIIVDFEIVTDVESPEAAQRWDRLVQVIKMAAKTSDLIKEINTGRKQGYPGQGELRELRKSMWANLKTFLKDRSEENKKLYNESRNNLKKARKIKKQKYWEQKWAEIEKAKDLTNIWRAIKPFRNKKEKQGENISSEEWLNHFRKLLDGKEGNINKNNTNIQKKSDPVPRTSIPNIKDFDNRQETNDENNSENNIEMLNRDITWQEMEKVVRNLKRNKAAGPDDIKGEFIKYMPREGQIELWCIMNEMWKNTQIGRGWETARIFPIWKAGDTEKAENYRGIALLDVGYKMLTNIMANRIRNWLEKEKLLVESQAGFREGRGTRDHVFTLNALINNKLRKKGGKLFCAFIDLKAAFDSIDRKILTQKLDKIGIKGKMLGMIEKIYSLTLNEIITGEGISEKFQTEKGVRQGCPLSPILFNIFINDIDVEWNKRNEGGTVIGRKKVYNLKFADDIAMLADDSEGLQNMLNTLGKYLDKNNLVANSKKSKILVFKNGGRRKKGESWTIKGNELERVDRYKYLGVWFNETNTFEKHFIEIEKSIRKTINATWGLNKRARINSLRRKLQVMEGLARSKMLYGVETWGWRNRKKVDRQHARYVKMSMGLSVNTPDYLWRLESGNRSLGIHIMKRATTYLLDIIEMRDERLPKICLREEARNLENNVPSKWGLEFRKAIEEVGIGLDNIIVEIKKGNSDRLRELFIECIERKTEQEIQNDWSNVDKSKYAKNYKYIKDNFLQENYWEREDVRVEHKECWARIRCNNIGREKCKGFKDSKCRFCKKQDETLAHLLICSEARLKIDNKVADEIADLFGNSEDGATVKLCKILKGKTNINMCNYIREITKSLAENT